MRLLPIRSPLPVGALLVAACLFLPLARAADFRYFDDAALHAVYFIDEREGWAVGDAGVIWHSMDKGATWERQPSGVRASLRSVQFLNSCVGWVAGREELPNGGSAGVVLFTNDGGQKWRRILLNALPGLNRVVFLDMQNGYLVGDGAEQYPTGVFVTTDAGRNWQPVPGPHCPSWLAADFNRDGGALAGAWNRQATVRNNRVHAINTDILGGRNLRGLQLRGDGGVAVGQGGLVLLSSGTRAARWGMADLKLPRDTLAGWDFHAVHGTGPHIWAVGRPGSVALHSPDNGKTWEVVRTGQSLPLNGLFFRDKFGWAVGELGTILTTSDAGRTWEVRKRGGQRAASLFVHARATSAPLDTVALLGGADGYLTVGLSVTAADPSTTSLERAADGQRLRQAVREAGGASAESLWSFPLGSHLATANRADVLRAWDALHGDRSADQLLRQLVLAIRIWQPDVLITDDAASGHATDGLVVEAMREAFRQAGEPTAFPEQLTGLGLSVWKSSKLYGLTGRAAAPGVSLDLTALSPRLGTTVRELAAGPQELLAASTVTVPAERHYRLLADRLPGSANHRELMQGIALAAGGAARRPAVAGAEVTPEVLRAVRARNNLRALVESAVAKDGQRPDQINPDRLLAQIGPMLADMPDDHAARAAHGVACQFARAGQWTQAREAFLLLVDRYPTHPLSIDGYRWLVRHNSSSEARRRHELGQFLVVQHIEFGLPVPLRGAATSTPKLPPKEEKEGDKKGAKNEKKGEQKAIGLKAPEMTTAQARRMEQLQLLGSKEDMRKWYQSSLSFEPRLAAFGSLFATDPAIQFCLQSARRNLGELDRANQWYRNFAQSSPDGPWRAAALAELWLNNRVGSPPKPVLVCKPTDKRPYLDGKLDDECWQSAAPVKLQSAAGDTTSRYPTEVRMSHDRDFLYVAVRCGHPAGEGVPAAKVRTRDADLRGQDRISVMLDLDRDYSTCFHFQVDGRGCVAEDCWGDRTWCPRWFVAVHREATAWVAEIAIPMAALTGDIVTPGRAWAANVVRVLPGRGVQAWSLPAEVPEEAMRLEGMGLLMFTQKETRQAAGARP
jgi:photosystem II stability/assembly factor-like uncharacterized protein